MADARAIEDHGAIGDGRSVALVARDGAIDWLCWPRFDSPSLFAALLDAERGGEWRIAPAAPASVSRAYLPGTNVLETRFVTAGGTLVLTDLMAIDRDEERRRRLTPEHELLRLVRCEAGTVDVVVHFAPRPDFARRRVRVRDGGPFGIRVAFGSKLVTLRGERPLRVAGDAASATAAFRLAAGDEVAFSLTFETRLPATLPPLGDPARARAAATAAWWRGWLRPLPQLGDLAPAVERSVLAVKLLGFAPSGAIIAAPTTSLPERPGGDLNWDYRYCWLRDASFTTRALLAVGSVDDAVAFDDWLLHATRLTRPALRVLYDVYGNAPAREKTLDHLAGYRGSRPLRVRNAAAQQLQLDVYGEVIDAGIQTVDGVGGRLDREAAHMLAGFGRFVAANWRRPDHGIWEERSPPRHYTHSKVLCWVALDRLVTLHERHPLPGVAVGELARERAAIAADVLAHGFDPAANSYRAWYGGDEVDASLLQLAWYGFEEPDAPRMRGTWRRLEQRLRAGPGLYYRFEDSPRRGEGAFGICSFWFAEYLARGGGTLAEARAMFDATMRYANDVGLFAEEIDPRTGGALGNFPQAYTHVGIINAAVSIAQRARREERAAA